MNIFIEFEERIKDILRHSMNIQGVSCVSVETPRNILHGELSTNIAMILAKSLGENSWDMANRIAVFLRVDPDVACVEVDRPGFINVRLNHGFWLRTLAGIITYGADYGRSDMGKNIKVNVEYVSANPTGPLHVGHCRGAVLGDVLANLLRFSGYKVTKEYYINDAGGQVDILAQSAFLRYREALGEKMIKIPDGLYPGEYLIAVGKGLSDEFGNSLLNMNREKAFLIVKKYALDAMMRMIRSDLSSLGIDHDCFFYESLLHRDNAQAIRITVEDLMSRGHVYKGNLPPPKGQVVEDWEDREQILLRSTEMGDDMDRSLIKSDGSYTYFAADAAYFKDKYDRGFQEMIYILGADHSGYIKRLEAIAQAVANGQALLRVLCYQLVRLYRDGEPLRMGKRTGNFISLRDVVEEVGRDSVRFMMLYRKAEAPLDFDFAKVTENCKENPVFYVQYARARCSSIFHQACMVMQMKKPSRNDLLMYLGKLEDESECMLIRKLAEYPHLIKTAVLRNEPHRLAFYLYDLSSMFHGHWSKGNEKIALRFVQTDDRELTLARLGLVQAVSDVLSSGLSLLGVEAPDDMPLIGEGLDT
ncbi:MAG: arginyl-tRNA synthetase [Candidatus Tokpelaia sp. JSC161]|jgi:arginyl-tRNA synthetase|nr:MAG: arginyl-tRNA synthetase [Candidatus Tokpelaia sp. JSC161]